MKINGNGWESHAVLYRNFPKIYTLLMLSDESYFSFLILNVDIIKLPYQERLKKAPYT